MRESSRNVKRHNDPRSQEPAAMCDAPSSPGWRHSATTWSQWSGTSRKGWRSTNPTGRPRARTSSLNAQRLDQLQVHALGQPTAEGGAELRLERFSIESLHPPILFLGLARITPTPTRPHRGGGSALSGLPLDGGGFGRG